MAWKSWETPGYGPIRYKWRHSWSDKRGDAFVGFDGNQQIGQIFRIIDDFPENKWFWVMAATGRMKLNWPTAGFEETPKFAAKRVEWLYEHLLSGKPRYVM